MVVSERSSGEGRRWRSKTLCSPVHISPRKSILPDPAEVVSICFFWTPSVISYLLPCYFVYNLFEEFITPNSNLLLFLLPSPYSEFFQSKNKIYFILLCIFNLQVIRINIQIMFLEWESWWDFWLKSLGKFKGFGYVVQSHPKDWVSQGAYNRFIVLFCLVWLRGNSTSLILKLSLRVFLSGKLVLNEFDIFPTLGKAKKLMSFWQTESPGSLPKAWRCVSALSGAGCRCCCSQRPLGRHRGLSSLLRACSSPASPGCILFNGQLNIFWVKWR